MATRARQWNGRRDHYYINVPRLMTLAHGTNEQLWLPRNGDFKSLAALNNGEMWELRKEVVRFLASVKPAALPVRSIKNWTGIRPGALISFDHLFEARGVPDIFTVDADRWPPPGPFGSISRVVADHNLQLSIDPAWIMDGSGALWLRSGRSHIAGLAALRLLDTPRAIVRGTPLLLAL